MERKMHAAVVELFGEPLVLRELEIPIPGAGQILVKTEACGVCHTDLHAAHGDWPLKPTLPFYSWPRGHRAGRRRRIGRDDREGGRPGRGALANYVAHVSSGLGAKDAAPITCAGITTYKGIKETAAKPGEWIAGLEYLMYAAVAVLKGFESDALQRARLRHAQMSVASPPIPSRGREGRP